MNVRLIHGEAMAETASLAFLAFLLGFLCGALCAILWLIWDAGRKP